MSKPKKATIEVQGPAVTIVSQDEQDLICLTDNWLRIRDTVEFLVAWERLEDPGSNPIEFDGIKIQPRVHSLTLTPKQWIEKSGAVGSAYGAFLEPGPTRFNARVGRDLAKMGGGK